MRFYKQPHAFYAGVLLHARSMSFFLPSPLRGRGAGGEGEADLTWEHALAKFRKAVWRRLGVFTYR